MDPQPMEAEVTIARLENEIQVADVDILIPLPTPIPVEEKAEWEARCKCTKTSCPSYTHRGMAFSIIRGQCMQVLLDKMKHDPDFDAAEKASDPLYS
jgi:hypothetical protein